MTFLNRIAGAPITWGVDGSPGWGHLMGRERVLREMQSAGLRATELGPDLYLPTDPRELEPLLDAYGLSLIGAFVPLTLYRPELIGDTLSYCQRATTTLSGAGSSIMVVGPSSHLDGYDTPVSLSEADWDVFFENLQRVVDINGEGGLTTAVHPHWAMAVERPEHIYQLLERSDAGLCLDTGHIYLGGGDPVAIAKAAGHRVVHVHLKDVDAAKAEQVRAGDVPFRGAVIDDMFVPLGEGAVDIAGVVQHLESIGFDGWYVLEQDVSLAEEPAEGEGPLADALASVDFLKSISVAS